MRNVTATASQGLAIGGPAEVGFDKSTLPYVPGSTLRGALAAAWIREHGLPDASNARRQDFLRLFERDVRYGPLFQEGTSVVPLSAVWCKYPRTESCEQWGIDAAVDGEARICPHCHNGIDVGKGEITNLRRRRVMRTELDPQGRALDQHLFARHELTRGLRYVGTVAGHHPWLLQPRDIWLGGKSSTSGRVLVEVSSAEVNPNVATSPRTDGALVIRFTSPAIVVDDFGRPRLDPLPEILRALGVRTDAVTLSELWTRPARVGGWHAASGLPKPVEIAVAMGSVVVVRLDGEPDADRVTRMAQQGVGLRRLEGFGQIEVNPPAWRRAVRPLPEHAPAGGGVLAGVREASLLEKHEVVRWLLDRGHVVLLQRARDAGPNFDDLLTELLTERIAVHFDDQQADAVRALFTSPRLAAALPLIEQALAALQAPQQDAGGSGEDHGD